MPTTELDVHPPAPCADLPVLPGGTRTWPGLAAVSRQASGWLLVLAGLALIPLPGPGSVVAILGLRQLAPHHRWAARMYGPAHDRVMHAARLGVATWPRVTLSALGPVWLGALTAAYVAAVEIPRTTVLGVTIGPDLPFQGPGMVLGLGASAVASGVLLVVSVVAWGPGRGAHAVSAIHAGASSRA